MCGIQTEFPAVQVFRASRTNCTDWKGQPVSQSLKRLDPRHNQMADEFQIITRRAVNQSPYKLCEALEQQTKAVSQNQNQTPLQLTVYEQTSNYRHLKS